MPNWHDDFSMVANQLEASYPNLYASESIDDDDAGAEINFLGAVPIEAYELVRTVEVPVRLNVIDATISSAELRQRMNAIHRAVFADPDVADVFSTFDVRSGSLEFRVRPVVDLEHLSLSAQEALLGRLKRLAPVDAAITTYFVLVDTVGGFDY